MTIFEAKPPNQRQETLRTILIWSAVFIIVAGGMAAFLFRHWPQERRVDQFFDQVEAGDYKAAYTTWTADPEWEQHPEKYKDYTFGQFQLDWGPTGEYGKITRHEIEGSVTPKSTGNVTGIVVAVRVNNMASKPACIWVDNRTKALSYSPVACTF